MERRGSLPPSKRNSMDMDAPDRSSGTVPPLPLGGHEPSSSRPIPPLDLAPRGASGSSPAAGPGGLRSSRSNRSITWAGEDGAPSEVPTALCCLLCLAKHCNYCAAAIVMPIQYSRYGHGTVPVLVEQASDWCTCRSQAATRTTTQRHPRVHRPQGVPARSRASDSLGQRCHLPGRQQCPR